MQTRHIRCETVQLIVSKVSIVLFATISAAHGALVEWDYCAAGQQTFLTTYGSPAVSGFGVKRDVCSDGHVGWQDLRADRTSRPQAWYWGKPQSNFQSGFTSDFGKVKKWGKAEIGKADTHASLDSFRLQASVNCVDFTIVDLAGSKTDKGRGQNHGGSANAIIPSFTCGTDNVCTWSPTSYTAGPQPTWSNHITFGKPFEARCIRLEIGKWRHVGNDNVGFSKWRWWYDDTTTTTTTTATATTTTTMTATITTTTTLTSTTTATSTTASTATTSTSTTGTTKTTTTIPPSWYRRPTASNDGSINLGTFALQNDRLTIDPGSGRAVVVEGALHVVGSVTIDSTPADDKGVVDLGKELGACKAGQKTLRRGHAELQADYATLQADHAALQAQVVGHAERLTALELERK